MADAASLFDLAARISVDASQSDKALTDTQRKVIQLAKDFGRVDTAAKKTQTHLSQTAAQSSKLGEVFRGLSTTTASFEGPLGGIAGRMSSLSSLMTGLTSTTGGLGVALGALAVATVGASVAIYNLTTSVAESTGKFKDLAQQTGFSVETLSALSNAAETSGGSIDSVVNSLNIFQANMVAAREKGSDMAALFKTLKIDTENNEKALRQALIAISGLTRAEDQAAVGKKLLGRGFKELNAAVKEAGSLDEYLNEQLRRGTLITTAAAERGDQLADSVKEMQRAFDAARRVIADQFGPDVLRIVQSISDLLEENRGTIGSWAKDWVTYFRDAANGVMALYNAIKALNGSIAELAGLGIPDIIKYLSLLSPGGLAMFPAIGRMVGGGSNQPPSDLQKFIEPLNKPLSQQFKSLGKPQFGAAFVMPKGGGGGGGGGSQRDILEGLKSTIMGLNAEYRKYNTQLLDSATTSELAAEKEKLLSSIMGSLKANVRSTVSAIKDVDDAINAAIGSLPKKAQAAARSLVDQALAQFKANQELKIAGELNKRAEELTQKWREEMDRARGGMDEYAIAIAGLEKEYAKYGKTLEAGTRKELEQLAVMQRELQLVLSITRARQLSRTTRERLATREGRERPPWIDLGGGSTVGGEPATATRDRIATVDEQVARERLQIFQERVRAVAANITSVLDRALYDGLTGGGVKGGLASLGMGLLDIVNRFFLARIEEGLTEILTNLGGKGGGGGGGKGGFWSQLFSFAVGGLTGGFGGGPSPAAGGLGSGLGDFAGSFASGGTIPMGQWGFVHEGEKVKVGPRGAEVIPGRDGERGQPIINMNVYAQDVRSFERPETRTQIRNRMMRELRTP